MHQRRVMIIARSQDRLVPRSSTPRSADGWLLLPQWETADDRAIDRPALRGDGLSINADPHDTVLVRHDGRNNVIGILKPRRMGPDCDWSATRFLQSLAQLCVGFACVTMEPRPFAMRSTRSLQHKELRAVRNAVQATGDESFVHQSSQRKLRLSERDHGSAWRQLAYPVRQGSERRKELEILVSRGARVSDQDQYFRPIAKPTLKRAEEFGIGCGCVAHGVTVPSGWLQATSGSRLGTRGLR